MKSGVTFKLDTRYNFHSFIFPEFLLSDHTSDAFYLLRVNVVYLIYTYARNENVEKFLATLVPFMVISITYKIKRWQHKLYILGRKDSVFGKSYGKRNLHILCSGTKLDLNQWQFSWLSCVRKEKRIMRTTIISQNKLFIITFWTEHWPTILRSVVQNLTKWDPIMGEILPWNL